MNNVKTKQNELENNKPSLFHLLMIRSQKYRHRVCWIRGLAIAVNFLSLKILIHSWEVYQDGRTNVLILQMKPRTYFCSEYKN